MLPKRAALVLAFVAGWAVVPARALPLVAEGLEQPGIEQAQFRGNFRSPTGGDGIPGRTGGGRFPGRGGGFGINPGIFSPR